MAQGAEALEGLEFKSCCKGVEFFTKRKNSRWRMRSLASAESRVAAATLGGCCLVGLASGLGEGKCRGLRGLLVPQVAGVCVHRSRGAGRLIRLKGSMLVGLRRSLVSYRGSVVLRTHLPGVGGDVPLVAKGISHATAAVAVRVILGRGNRSRP